MKIKMFFYKLKNIGVNLYHKNKKLCLAFLCIMLVAVILFVSSKGTTSKKQESKSSSPPVVHSTNDYENMLETKIEQLLLSLDSIKKAKAMVVCDSSLVYNYVFNSTETGNAESSKTTSKEVAYEKNGSNSTAIIESISAPKVVGVMIVTNNITPATKLSIINSLSSVLNVSSSCISLLQES